MLIAAEKIEGLVVTPNTDLVSMSSFKFPDTMRSRERSSNQVAVPTAASSAKAVSASAESMACAGVTELAEAVIEAASALTEVSSLLSAVLPQPGTLLAAGACSSAFLASATTLSTVKPNFAKSSSAGAEAP